MLRLEHDLSDRTNPKAYNMAVRQWLVFMGNKGATSDQDALAATGLSAASLQQQVESWFNKYANSGETEEMHNLGMEVLGKIKASMEARTFAEYERQVETINRNAPNAYAKQQARDALNENYAQYGWFKRRSEMSDEESARRNREAQSRGKPKPAATAPRKPASASPGARPRSPTSMTLGSRIR